MCWWATFVLGHNAPQIPANRYWAILAYPGNILTKAVGIDPLEFSRSNPVEQLVYIVVCAAPAHAGAVFFMTSEAVNWNLTGVPFGGAAPDVSVRPLFLLTALPFS